MRILTRLDLYQKVSVCSGKTGNNRHDIYSKTTSRDVSRARCGPLHDLCRLEQSFYTISRDVFLENNGKPRFIAMVRQFHGDMQTRIQNDGEYSEPFPVTNGGKQGCVVAQNCSA